MGETTMGETNDGLIEYSRSTIAGLAAFGVAAIIWWGASIRTLLKGRYRPGRALDRGDAVDGV